MSSNLMEFKITHSDKVEGGIIPSEDILQARFDLKPHYEVDATIKAYREGLIVLKFEWVFDIENDGQKLIVYRGKVEYV